MKKSSKPVILFVMFYLAAAALFILGYVGIKLNCEGLTKKKVLAEEKLAEKKNWKLNLTAEKQSLIGEERIVKIAEDELGMVKKENPVLVLQVSKDRIEKISEEIKNKYE